MEGWKEGEHCTEAFESCVSETLAPSQHSQPMCNILPHAAPTDVLQQPEAIWSHCGRPLAFLFSIQPENTPPFPLHRLRFPLKPAGEMWMQTEGSFPSEESI